MPAHKEEGKDKKFSEEAKTHRPRYNFMTYRFGLVLTRSRLIGNVHYFVQSQPPQFKSPVPSEGT